MHDRAAWSVLIPAAGAGVRLGQGPKALMLIDGRSVVDWVVDKALLVSDDVVVGMPPDRLLPDRPDCRFIAGGATRGETIGKLLAAARHGLVLVHDGARPFCSVDLMLNVADAAAENGAAAAFMPAEVPVATAAEGWLAATLPRDEAGTVHTPAAFRRDILEVAYAAAKSGTQAHSTIELVMAAGFRIRAVPGERTNIKITVPDDLALAAGLLDRLQVR